MKICIKCGANRPEDRFYKRKNSKDGLRSECKDCRSKSDNRRYLSRRDILLKQSKQRHIINKDKISKQHKQRHLVRRSEILEKKKQRYLSNKSKATEYSKQRYLVKRAEILKYQKQYHKDRRNNDPGFKLLTNLRIGIYHALQNNQKSGHTTDLLGCSIEFFKQYLESQFQPGMSWDNQGKWHIDHIIPCSSFNLLVLDQQRLCFNYHNLQPLWARDNMSKSNKIVV